ncbi:RDD family protein [Lysobacter sp. D1-1-M9]|uniref:RDD family protein n=1 Tax=Novilysobacter longmucuonensis TaxID=3098603 RepID=UPI002FC59457
MASDHRDRPSGTPATAPLPPAALIGWRWLALLYDLFPALGLWFTVGVLSVALHGGEPVRADTLAGWLELAALWSVTGAYAVLSWRRGGQTLGMRAWRLRVAAPDGGRPGWRALMLRYAVATASLLLAGAGFWWAWFDRDRLTWHDRASGTRMRREARGH